MTIELYFDTETNGLLRGNKPPEEYGDIFPLEIAAILEDSRWPSRRQYLVGFIDWPADGREPSLDPAAAAVNGITSIDMLRGGLHPKVALVQFLRMVDAADVVVAHNTEFDWRVIQVWQAKYSQSRAFPGKAQYCTMKSAVELCKLPGARGYKWPKLQELHEHLFKSGFADAHGAMADCLAARKCYKELVRLDIPSAVGPMGG